MTQIIDTTLNGYISNLFVSRTPAFTEADFDNNENWVCDLLDQSEEVTNKYIKYRLHKAETRRKKLEFLYECMSCCKYKLRHIEYMYFDSDNEGDEIQETHRERKERFAQAIIKIEEAIAYVEDCKRLGVQETETSLCKLTNNQTVLLFYYGLKELGIEPRQTTDVTIVAKFIHLILGKEVSSISNSDFYKRLKKVPNFNKDRRLIEDLKTIKPCFEKAQMKEAIKAINKEIATASRELKSK